jgi:hypothetical protein
MDNAILHLYNSNPNTIIQMEMTPVSELKVVNVLHSLKPKDSVGYDGISIKILKYCAPVIKKSLSHILNCSLMSGICPDRCKFSIVKPIHKNVNLMNWTIPSYQPFPKYLKLSCTKDYFNIWKPIKSWPQHNMASVKIFILMMQFLICWTT